MRTKGECMNVMVGGMVGSAKPLAAALAARALRAAGFTVLAMDQTGRLLDEKEALRGLDKADRGTPVLVCVRGDAGQAARISQAGGRKTPQCDRTDGELLDEMAAGIVKRARGGGKRARGGKRGKGEGHG